MRTVAVIVLVLLGAPVAMHVVMHDLHDHHDERAIPHETENGHGDHEHPLVSSSAPQVPSGTRVSLPLVAVPAAMPLTWTSIARAKRNVVAFGALRTDTDVGVQSLLSTFLI